jgi:cyanophycinase
LQNRTFFLEVLEVSVIPLPECPTSRPVRLPHTYRFGLQAAFLTIVIPLAVGIAPSSAGDSPVAPKKAGPVALARAPAGPTGSLVIVGGGFLPDSVRLRFLDLAGGKKARLVVIPTASEWGDKTGVFKGFELWKNQPAASVTMLHTLDRKKANDPAFIKPLTEATGVWISGGDQARLTAAYSGTAVERELRKMFARGGVIGGTSAGAAVMSSLMIVSGNPDAKVGTGLGLLADVVIDQHFRNRNRLKRLQSVLDRYPDHLGLGIDEETAIVVQCDKATVLGNANVSLCLPAALRRLPLVQVFKSGDIIDLSPLFQAVHALPRPVPVGTR